MALYEMQGRGPHFDDLRTGVIAATLVNLKTDPKRHPLSSPLDFIPWNELHSAPQAAPILLDDPDAQSALIESVMFPKNQ